MSHLIAILPPFVGSILDRLLGDPACLPHPVVGFGKAIGLCERRFNRGNHRSTAGAFTALGLVVGVYLAVYELLRLLAFSPWVNAAVQTVLFFYCLAGTTLTREVRMAFLAADRSLEQGRKQVSRIVGRDTDALTDQEVRIAALETLAENLSDGVVAPLFWYALLGVPGMVAYKMVNTLDSMIGYRTERYRQFGCVAARLDDIANWIPARLTALLMALASGHPLRVLRFVRRYGSAHASPNSGYPESALAGVLDCRFGGPHEYFGQMFDKPYIGENPRPVDSNDMHTAIRINRIVEIMALTVVLGVKWLVG